MATLWTEETVAAHQDIRRQRAEASEFEFTIIDGRDIVTNPKTGKSYVVDAAGSCTCDDQVYRGAKHGTLCKHILGLRLRKLEAGS